MFQPVPVFQQGVRPGGEQRRRALGAATCGFEPHGHWESIGATAEGWGGPGGPAPAAGTVGCSSVPFRSRLSQCARIGFGGKEAALDPGSSTNRRAIGFHVDCGTERQSPCHRGRPRGRQVGGPRFGTLTREYLKSVLVLVAGTDLGGLDSSLPSRGWGRQQVSRSLDQH